MQPHFQVGIVVPDLDRAMLELGQALGIEWKEPQERRNGSHVTRITFSTEAPYLELIEGCPGSPWDASSGPAVHHLGFWSDDPVGDRDRIEDAGLATEAVGEAPFGGGWSYHRGPHSGIRVEVCDSTSREGFLRRWGLAPNVDEAPHDPDSSAGALG
jgi:hypothetical protein